MSAHPELVEGSVAEASTTTVRTVINGAGPSTGSGGAGKLDDAAGVMNGFEGVALDAEAQAAIAAALEACAARARAAGDAVGEDRADFDEGDPDAAFVHLPHNGTPFRGALLPPGEVEAFEPFAEGEAHWVQAGAEVPAWHEEAVEAARRLALPAARRGGRRKR